MMSPPFALTCVPRKNLRIISSVTSCSTFRTGSGVTLFSLDPKSESLCASNIETVQTSRFSLEDDPGTGFAELTELAKKYFQMPHLTGILEIFCSPRLEVLQFSGNFDANVIAESLLMPYSTLPKSLRLKVKDSSPLNYPSCHSPRELDLSGSPSLKTGPVMRVVKQRLNLAASEEGRHRSVLKSRTKHGESSILPCPVVISEQVGSLIPSDNVVVVIEMHTTSLQSDWTRTRDDTRHDRVRHAGPTLAGQVASRHDVA